MEARRCYSRCVVSLATCLILLLVPSTAWSQRLMRGASRHVAQSENFIVFASSPDWAARVAEAAETQRRELAVYWLGRALPAWPERCPIHVTSGSNLGASGKTQFSLLQQPAGPPMAGNWTMAVAGTPERVIDSVLPHEITHTIFASHFGQLGKYVPRWADEGACTTVEHEAEKSKHRHLLLRYLQTGQGLPFNIMFSLKDYPRDPLPLYAQGHSTVQFLLSQGGPKKFIEFLEMGMKTEQWERVLREQYQYKTLGEFQTSWNNWIADGSPKDLLAYAPSLRDQPQTPVVLAANAKPTETPMTEAPATQFAVASSSAVADQSLSGDASLPSTVPATTAVLTLPTDPISLASTQELALPPATVASMPAASRTVASIESGSFYQSRLRHFSSTASDSSTNAPTARVAAGTQLRPQQTTGRPNQPQSSGIQVLYWGSRGPVNGIEQ